MFRTRGANHLLEQVERNQRLAAALDESNIDRAYLHALQHWQRARLRETYADLKAQPRYREACIFFLEELYGGDDVRERDRQLGRVVPVMRRSLPDHLLYAIGEAMRLQAISQELDLQLAETLVAEIALPIDQPAYARAYREVGAWEQREEQIVLIGRLGRLLDDTVRKTFVRRLLRMMRGPSRVAGFGTLQNFLERGLDAFAAMGGADQFVDTILTRERQALEAMRRGEDWPFEAWIGRRNPG